jgi:hypothetical protein
MRKTLNKKFDCIRLKENIQNRIYENIKNMSAQDEIDYYQKNLLEGPFRKWYLEIIEKKSN